ncbi:hypothetical protein [Chromohalobacter sp. 48-RD10]|uniref:hypothetical protein n=1 Tax=Chromohalobacter sp. 48-RD10 TaxID=2994063 RepID=UPI00246975E3|nr:hypothetical protein [Chromohalobacter sp. 48-RD10]
MSYSKEKIISEIDAYMTSHGGTPTDWYVGIAENPRERLFSGHNVSEDGVWIYCPAASEAIARSAEKAYLDTGHDGGGGGGGASTDYVYAYKKTLSTRE